LPRHTSRFVQFAVNVMGVENDFTSPEQTAEKGIRAMERFYKEIGMPITIKELLGRDVTDEEIEVMADKCSRGGTITVGTLERLGREEMVKIYKMAK
jgi:alcohol dehydrogenase YqhD (iron-dependent ADH family)